MVSITIGKWMIGFEYGESLPSMGMLRFFVFDLEADDEVVCVKIW